jgi:hypothetical protein
VPLCFSQELVDNDEAHFADAGGFVSPSGISYIGVSKQKLGQVGLEHRELAMAVPPTYRQSSTPRK